MSSAKKNFFYQSLYQILTIILPFITAPYVARTLGKDNVGIYSYTNTIAYYFVLFAMLGFEQYGNRKIAQNRDNTNDLNRSFSELLVIHLISSVFCFILYVLYVLFIVKNNQLYAIIQGMYVLSAVFDINWFFFGIEKFKITVTRNIIIKIVTVVCIFLFVHDGTDLWKYCAIMSGSCLLSSLAIWTFLPKYVDVKAVKYKDCIQHIKPLLALFVAVVAAHVYRMIDKAMLGWFNQYSGLGCYEYADRIIRIPLSLITALGTVMLSRMSNLFANKKKAQAERILDSSALFVIFMSFALSFGLAAIAPEFVIIFLGEEYAETVILVELLAVTIPLVAWNNYVRTQMLIPLGRDKVYTKAVSFGAISNVIVNIFLIYFFGAKGAAIATILSYIIVLVIQTVPMIKEFKIIEYIRYVPFFFLFGLVMYFLVRIIGHFMGISVITVIVEVLSGAIVYALLTYVYLYFAKREMLLSLINQSKESIRRRFKKNNKNKH